MNDYFEASDEDVAADPDLMRKVNLDQSIFDAFRDVNAASLRRWFVRTFIMDPTNWDVLKGMVPTKILARRFRDKDWPTIEHKAIGLRLIWRMDPTMVAGAPPDITEPDTWNNEADLARMLLYMFKPWDQMRYDPEGENWYSVVAPGQWQRHGKGNPSNGMAEETIASYFDTLAQGTTLVEWATHFTPLDPNKFADAATMQAAMSTSVKRCLKFPKSKSAIARIRSMMEIASIMHVDVSTFNQIRTIAPFANGALCLVTESYKDVMGVEQTNRIGDLMKFDPDYMVTNANSLPWNDVERHIPNGFAIAQATGDWSHLDEYEDELMLTMAPTFWSFLTHAFPDYEERTAFMRLIGAAMFGSNLKILAAMIGSPNAGKDTVINWLEYLMPGQVATLPASAFTAQGDDDRGFAPLMGKRVATVSGEVGEGRGSRLLADKIKTVASGGGTMRVAEKYEKPTTIYFDGMLWIQANSVPTIQGADQGVTNRLVAVEFKYPFPFVSDVDYEPRYRREAPAFAQVLFINYLRYQTRGAGMVGINPPDSWRDYAKEFANAANPHGFIEACIERTTDTIPTTQFHAALSALVNRFGSPYPIGANYWPKRLRQMGHPMKGEHSVRKQVRINGTPIWCYQLTINASLSDGMFTQQQWENILKDAAVV